MLLFREAACSHHHTTIALHAGGTHECDALWSTKRDKRHPMSCLHDYLRYEPIDVDKWILILYYVSYA